MSIDFGEGLEDTEIKKKADETPTKTPKKTPTPRTTPKKDTEKEKLKKKIDQLLKENEQIRLSLEEQNARFVGEMIELNEQLAEMGREGDKDLELLATLKSIAETVKILDASDQQLTTIYKDKIKKYNIAKLFELDWSKIKDKLINLSPDAYGGKYKTITERLKTKRQKYLLLPFFDFINTIVLKRENINNYIADEFMDNILPLNLDPITIETVKEYLLEQIESIN